ARRTHQRRRRLPRDDSRVRSRAPRGARAGDRRPVRAVGGMALLRAEEETKVREWFAALERPVELFVALGPEETPRAGAGDVDFGDEMVRVCERLPGPRGRVGGAPEGGGG